MTGFADRSNIVAAIASAFIGATTLILLMLGELQFLMEFMRVFPLDEKLPSIVQIAPQLAALFAVLSLLLSTCILAAYWVLKRLHIRRGTNVLLLLCGLTFLLTFAFETASQIERARGNLTASDSAGLIIENARLTAHGWETIARRALIASTYVGLLSLTFSIALRLGRKASPV